MALYTDPEEIYLMKKSGDVIMYDATEKKEHVKISNVIKVKIPFFSVIVGSVSDPFSFDPDLAF